jgi:glycosyltransferase involved in cell wall biosynthesis
VVTYTHDFGSNSPYLSRYLGKKLHVIPPPVVLSAASEADVADFRKKHLLDGNKVIGISARMAAEKGIEVLLSALPAILDRYPNTQVLHANPDAIGELDYLDKLAPLFADFSDNYHLLGPLSGSELTAFYRNLDCLVLCSLNNTETFGLVQIEAMMNGTPVIASNLPGVRQPVSMTGMGEIVPIGDHDALAVAALRVLENKSKYVRSASVIARSFDPEATASEYVGLFESLLAGDRSLGDIEPVGYGQLREMRDRAVA